MAPKFKMLCFRSKLRKSGAYWRHCNRQPSTVVKSRPQSTLYRPSFIMSVYSLFLYSPSTRFLVRARTRAGTSDSAQVSTCTVCCVLCTVQYTVQCSAVQWQSELLPAPKIREFSRIRSFSENSTENSVLFQNWSKMPQKASKWYQNVEKAPEIAQNF